MGEQRGLQRADRPPPDSPPLQALAPAWLRRAEPLARVDVAGHQQRRAGRVGNDCPARSSARRARRAAPRYGAFRSRPWESNPSDTLYKRSDRRRNFIGSLSSPIPAACFRHGRRPRSSSSRARAVGDGRRGSPTSAQGPARRNHPRVACPAVEVWASWTCAPARCASRRRNATASARRCISFARRPARRIPHDLDLVVANLPYLAPGTPGYEDEPARRCSRAATGSTTTGGSSPPPPTISRRTAASLQFDGEVLEAERNELPWLRSRLESLSPPRPTNRAIGPPRERTVQGLICAKSPIWSEIHGIEHTGGRMIGYLFGAARERGLTRERVPLEAAMQANAAARIGRNHHAFSE